MAWQRWMALGLAFAGGTAADSAYARNGKEISGIAAYYSADYEGPTASGAAYNPKKYTCAHKTLPFGTRLRVTDKKTHRSVDVVVNDRGPFTDGRVFDLSLAAAKALGMIERGLIEASAQVRHLPRAKK
jgi:rare lipoprotein A